jgi:hypothetical protein
LGIGYSKDLIDAETLKCERLGTIEKGFDMLQLDIPAQDLGFHGLIVVGPQHPGKV